MMNKKTAYLVGAFTKPDWREEFIKNFPEIGWIDPRENPQSSMAKAVFSDLEASLKSDMILCYIPPGKKSAGTTSYVELGVAKANGRPIVTVDERGMEEKEEILDRISSYYFLNRSEAFSFLKEGIFDSRFKRIIKRDNPTKKNYYQNIYFAGDIEPLGFHAAGLRKRGKNINIGFDPCDLEEFKEMDLMVVNFNKGTNYNKKDALYFMGVSYALDIPIILVDENPVNYPTLPAVARRTFHKKGRFDELSYYLDNLESLRINEEALVYYNLMEKLNKRPEENF